MEPEQFGMTSALTGFVQLGFGLILFVARWGGTTPASFKNFAKGHPTVTATAILCAVVTQGILAEDTSDWIRDMAGRRPYPWSALLQIEANVRSEPPFGPTHANGTTSSRKAASMAQEFAVLGLRSTLCGPSGFEIQNKIPSQRELGENELQPDTTVSKCVSSPYYFAKNECYLHDGHRGELEAINHRSDFRRSVVVFGAIFALLGPAAACICRKRHKWTAKEVGKRAGGLFGSGVAIVVLVHWPLGHEEVQFNKRVFGYFAWLVRSGAVSPQSGIAIPTQNYAPWGIGGIARLSETSFLVVHDAKAGTDDAVAGVFTPTPAPVGGYVHRPASTCCLTNSR